MLKKMEKAKNQHAGTTMGPAKLVEIGITKNQSSRWQLSSQVAEKDFVRIIAECNDTKEVDASEDRGSAGVSKRSANLHIDNQRANLHLDRYASQGPPIR